MFVSEATAEIVRARYQRLEHYRLQITGPGRARRTGSFTASALTVAHARERRFITHAWHVTAGSEAVVYESHVAYLTPELRLGAGATVLVLDGAHRRLFSHLTIDAALPAACSWPVDSIIPTQIGRSAPPHLSFSAGSRPSARRRVPPTTGSW